MSSNDDESDVRTLPQMTFHRASVEGFVMTTTKPLGELSYLRIWHDNAGIGDYASWFLTTVIVKDMQVYNGFDFDSNVYLQTGIKYQFVANKWLAVEKGDGQIDRILMVSGPEVPIKRKFHQSKENALKQSHLWMSPFMRPPRSRFTRYCVSHNVSTLHSLQVSKISLRFQSHLPHDADQHYVVGLGLNCLIFMILSVRYGTHIPNGGVGFFSGFISLSIEELIIGILSNFIAFPFVLFVVFLFKYSRQRELRENRLVQALFSDETEEDLEINEDDASRPQSGRSQAASRPSTRPASAVSAFSTFSNESVASQAEANIKRKFSLPWFCTYLAWCLCLTSIFVSAFFIWAYGMSLGNDKTYRWLTSFFVTLLSSFFVVEPIKILMLALFYQIFCKASMDSDIDNCDEDEEPFILEDSEEWYSEAKTRKTKVYRPYSKKYLAALKEARIKDISNQAVASELFTYLIFLAILFIVSYDNRDPDSFKLKDHLENNLIIKNRFDQVKTSDDWWRWAHATLVSEIKAGPKYNLQPPYGLRGYIGDHTQRIMGFANLRQVSVYGVYTV